MSMSVKLVTFGTRANQRSLINGCYYTSSQGICMIIFEIDGCTQGGVQRQGTCIHPACKRYQEKYKHTCTRIYQYLQRKHAML